MFSQQSVSSVVVCVVWGLESQALGDVLNYLLHCKFDWLIQLYFQSQHHFRNILISSLFSQFLTQPKLVKDILKSSSAMAGCHPVPEYKCWLYFKSLWVNLTSQLWVASFARFVIFIWRTIFKNPLWPCNKFLQTSLTNCRVAIHKSCYL